jgi:hypothetical protein
MKRIKEVLPVLLEWPKYGLILSLFAEIGV